MKQGLSLLFCSMEGTRQKPVIIQFALKNGVVLVLTTEKAQPLSEKIAISSKGRGIAEGRNHGLINYIDTTAKCRHKKDFFFKGALGQVFYLSEAPSPPMTPYPPPYTLYTCKKYTYSFFLSFLTAKA
jgi:hypothetical protein